MLALLSDAFDALRNTRQRVIDDLRMRNVGCDREVKSQYRQEMANTQNSRTHEK